MKVTQATLWRKHTCPHASFSHPHSLPLKYWYFHNSSARPPENMPLFWFIYRIWEEKRIGAALVSVIEGLSSQVLCLHYILVQWVSCRQRNWYLFPLYDWFLSVCLLNRGAIEAVQELCECATACVRFIHTNQKIHIWTNSKVDPGVRRV